ncbi:MAG: phage holin family protein [Candidatus Taylorbacteria bacterium]|nr:phage holin family protein [Candidatus Taylorbacteria bacterium]
MKTVLKVVIVALAIMGLPRFIPDISVDSFWYALLAALVLGLVNLLIKPLVKLVTLPINLLTLGLFGLVINAGLLWLVAGFVPGFDIGTFLAAFLGGLAVAAVNWIVSKF